MDPVPLEVSFQVLASLTTRQVLGLQLVSRDWNALAMNYLAQTRTLELTTLARVVNEAVERLLPHMPDLRSLNAAKCYKLTANGVAAILKSCPRLQALQLEGCRITDAALRSITAANPPLRVLNLRECKLVTDSGMQDLLQHFVQLQYLNVSGCKIRWLGLDSEKTQDSLRLLDVSRTNLSGEALKDIAKRFPGLINDACIESVTKMLPNLCSLELENCYELTDQADQAGVAKIAAHCPKLENLQLEQCFKVTDQSLTLLSTSCPSLIFLKIRGCNVTAEGMAAFKSMLPGCQVLREKGQRREYRLILPEDPLAPLTFGR